MADVYGRELTDADLESNPLGIRGEVYAELESQFLDILRRAILAYLWLAAPNANWDEKTEPPSIRAGLTRQEMLALADAARRNEPNAIARIAELVPGVARSPVQSGGA